MKLKLFSTTNSEIKEAFATKYGFSLFTESPVAFERPLDWEYDGQFLNLKDELNNSFRIVPKSVHPISACVSFGRDNRFNACVDGLCVKTARSSYVFYTGEIKYFM